MPNGGDKSWVRVRQAVEGFVVKRGQPSVSVEMYPCSYADLVGRVQVR